MRNILEQIGRVSVTLVGLGLFGFCFFQLVFVTRVVTNGGSQTSADERANPEGVVQNIDTRPVILIDAGHGGTDGGAVSGGLIEKNLALSIAKKLVSVLGKDDRFRVVMTRDDDTFVGLDDRAKMANDLDVALLVSVHLNSIDIKKYPDGVDANGIETWFAWPKPIAVMLAEKSKFGLPSGQRFIDERGEFLADRVQAAVCESTGARSRGVKNKGHKVTRLVGAPAIIVECGFLTNPKERARLVDSGYQMRVATGIASGVFTYLDDAMAEPMFGIHQPVRPEKERILSLSAPAVE